MNIKHPTIIKFVGYSKKDFLNEKNITLIMDYAKNGSLCNVIKKIQENCKLNDLYTNTSRQIILIGIARGMKYLHDRNIIHRDLKLDNILLDDDFHPLITDFGMSKFFETGHTYSQSQYGGTISYIAPEIFRNDPYGPEADVYSFAILMFEVVTDSLANPDLLNGTLNAFFFRNKVVSENYRPKFTKKVKSSIKKLIEKCWSDDPKERPTFNDIFKSLTNNDDSGEDFFLNGVDKKKVNSYINDISEINDPLERLTYLKKKK